MNEPATEPNPTMKVAQPGIQVIVVAVWVGVMATIAWACEEVTVRDAAFGEPRDVHRLCVIGKADDAATNAIADRLEGWLKSDGAGLNLELVRVEPDDPGVQWDQVGIPSAPPSLPVVVLAGRHVTAKRTFFIQHWEPAPGVRDLEALRTSPAREAIRREVGRRLAVLLYIPGTGPDAGSAEGVIEAVVKRWSKKEPLGVSVVRVSRSDEREQVLLSFVGVKPSGPDWVAPVFGRGKFMTPIEGADITESRLDGSLEVLIGACTCLRSSCDYGVDIPMTWDAALDAAVVPLRTGEAAAAQEPAPAAPLVSQSVAGQTTASPARWRVLRTTLWALAALLFLSGVATVTIIIRNNRYARIKEP